MRRASIIKFIKCSLLQRDVVLTLALLGLALSSGLSAAAQPKKEPLPASIEAAKAGPYVKTSLDPKPAAPSAAGPAISEKTASPPVKDKKSDKKSPPAPLPQIVKRAKESLPAADATPAPAPANGQKEGVSALLKGPQNKGKYIKIPAPTVDLTPPPPAASANTKTGEAPKDAPADPARKAEADSVINDLEDLAAAPPPPPQRDAKTGNVMLPNKSRTVVVEKGSVVLDSSALKTIIEAQNRNDLVAYGNTMGKSLAENLTLLSPFYSFSLTVGSGSPTAIPEAKPSEPALAPSDTKTKSKKTKKASPKKI